MDLGEILAAYDAELRRDLDQPGLRVERDGDVTRIVGSSAEPQDNCVLYSRSTPETVDALIAAQVARFRSLGHAFEWKHHDHDEPANLASRLAAHGFEPLEAEAFAVFDLSYAVGEPAVPAGIRVEQLTDVGRFVDLDRVGMEVWGDAEPWRARALGQEYMADPAAVQVHVAYDGSRPVASAWMRFHRGTRFASLWGGSTLPAYRGRGIYKALVRIRAAEAKARGFRWLTVDASPDSRPILERLGFQVAAMTTPYVWRP